MTAERVAARPDHPACWHEAAPRHRARGCCDRGDDITIACPASLAEKDHPIYRAAHAYRADTQLSGDLRDFGPFMNQPQPTGGLLIQTVASYLEGL